MNYEAYTFIFAFLAFLCLVALFFVGALLQSTHRQKKLVTDKLTSTPCWFWKLHLWICKENNGEALLFHLTSAQYILGTLYVLFYCATILGTIPISLYVSSYAWINGLELFRAISSFLLLISTYFVFTDLLPRTWAYYSAPSLLRFIYRPSVLILLLLSPLLLSMCTILRWMSPHSTFSSFGEPGALLIDLVRGIKPAEEWGEADRRVLQSVLHFRDRIAREIMRPRVELFCLPEEITVQQAAQMLQREGYSRVPVYKDTVDTIIGVLFYKDVLAKYITATQSKDDREEILSMPIKNLVKKVFYCPETKKIASLLQEFRKRQTHIAVIVDEYGGTSGLVTIEDILEEIVGEIADEYDIEETLFRPKVDGGWIIDARMNLLDIEEELGIIIPQEEDYDTLAGYVFYRVGSIPQAGLTLHHDRFELEVLKSNDRMVEEVSITPLQPDSEDQDLESSPT